MDEQKRKKLLQILICPQCLTSLEGAFVCTKCGSTYLQDERASFIVHTGSEYDVPKADGLFIVLKEFFKKYPRVYAILTTLFGGLVVTQVGKHMLEAADQKETIALNLGSGPLREASHVIAVDYFPYENIDVVMDISQMPIRENAVDLIICEFVLEHARDPEKIMGEIHRILKPGGSAYVAVPFVAAFHSAPDDFYRWSAHGLRALIERHGLSVVAEGIVSGPTSAYLNILTEWVAVLLSFGSRRLHSAVVVLMLILTAPFNLLDYALYRLPSAANAAHGIYLVSKK